MNPLRNCIKKVVRIIQFKNKYEHTLPLFKKLNILPLDAQIKHKQAIIKQPHPIASVQLIRPSKQHSKY